MISLPRPGPWFSHRLLTALIVGGFLALLIVAAWL